MASDKDPQEHALELPPEKIPEGASEISPEVSSETVPVQTTLDSGGDPPEQVGEASPETSPRLSIFRRFLEAVRRTLQQLKQLLQTVVSRIAAAGRGLMQRFRRRAKTPDEEDRKADHPRDAHTPDERTGDEAPVSRKRSDKPAPAEAVKAVAPRSAVRNLFLYLLALIVGGIAGMGFSFALLSTMLSNQAQKIGDQRDEIAQMETQLARIRQSETKYRLENVEYQKRLGEIEKRLNSVMQNPGGNAPSAESGSNPGAPAKSPMSSKTGKCTLEPGKIGDNLSRCLDEFNRK